MADFKINMSLDDSSSSLENSSFRNDNSNLNGRTLSHSSKVSSAISLIDDSEDESDETLASDKENNEDINDLEESIFAEPEEVLSQEKIPINKTETKFKRRSQLPVAKPPTMRYRDSSSESEEDTPQQQLNSSDNGSVDLLNSSNESDSPKIERKNRRVFQSSSSETEMVSDSPDETDDDLM